MDQLDRGTLTAPKKRGVEPSFTHPIRQIFVMLVVLGLVGFGVFIALPRVLPVFQANLYLNGFILFVFVIGLLACFWQVWQVFSSVGWIEDYVQERNGHDPDRAPRLLASLAALLRSNRGSHLQIGAASARSILDSIATRIDEARDITRYIVNLLIFLGLLGTFYGLATTVPAVVETIRSLAPGEGEGGVEVFNRLMTGLEEQLGGMGTAFSSSLLGLAGSLVVGLLELFAGHGQNRFYRELEEWLSTITKISFAAGDGESDDADAGAYLGVLAEQIEAMQSLFTHSDVQRTMLDDRLGQLADRLETLSTQLGQDGGQGEALTRLAEGQERLIVTLQAQHEEAEARTDAESRMRLRSIDVQLLRILEEMQAGRQESLSDLRSDMATLIHSIRVASGQDEA
ncbi:biopolymer transporter ExbB [Aliiroseovarius sp. F47248L]|uniref:biopolymer transporter ExbB n=1 Tax=Aliiroseovarius sp. F47248L TaxID=2926420 RepID=UPI001FF63152|nr:biopolymer transporter ExbB [Aliiroseovarius sp. F47248L]MCK0139568.1 biopolymer transporter ExbB [Aliiroseovarius sp. F47248L]